jgi:hypothetical protein
MVKDIYLVSCYEPKTNGYKHLSVHPNEKEARKSIKTLKGFLSKKEYLIERFSVNELVFFANNCPLNEGYEVVDIIEG